MTMPTARTTTSCIAPALWHEAPPASWRQILAGAGVLGRLVDDGTASCDDLPLLRRCHQVPVWESQADCWLVPPGLGAHFPLIESLLLHNVPLVVSIDGLGSRSMAGLRALIGERLVLGFDLRPLDVFALTEQLAWLAAQPESFAVQVETDQQAMMALLAGCGALLIGAGANIDPRVIARVIAARRPGTARPLTFFEIDGLDGKEVSLTVRHPLASGAVVQASDLDVAVGDNLGLSPTLARQVTGLRLRYPIAPGEPLHFGHFEDPLP